MRFYVKGNKHFLGVEKDQRSGEITYAFYKVEDGPRERSKSNFDELNARKGTKTDLLTLKQPNNPTKVDYSIGKYSNFLVDSKRTDNLRSGCCHVKTSTTNATAKDICKCNIGRNSSATMSAQKSSFQGSSDDVLSTDKILHGVQLRRKIRQHYNYNKRTEVKASSTVHKNFVLENIVAIPSAKRFMKACTTADLVPIASAVAVVSILGYYCVSTSGKLIDKSAK